VEKAVILTINKKKSSSGSLLPLDLKNNNNNNNDEVDNSCCCCSDNPVQERQMRTIDREVGFPDLRIQTPSNARGIHQRYLLARGI